MLPSYDGCCRNSPVIIRPFDEAANRIDTDTSNLWGYAYDPPQNGGSSSPANGDIWVGDQHEASAFAVGTYDFQAMLHKTGHALGLKHSFEEPTLPTAYDSYAYTLMSYTPTDEIVTFTSSGNQLGYSR